MKDDVSFAKYVVYRYLRTKPELEEYRDDLEQEALIGLLESHGKYDPRKHKSKDLWRYYQAWHPMARYVARNIQRHYLVPEADHDSPYWGIEQDPHPDELMSPETDEPRIRLMEVMLGVSLSPKEQEFLELFLYHGDLGLVSEAMGISKQRASRIYNLIISKAKATVVKT